ncbi:lectin domain containing protein [Pelagibacter phage HTVC031P]|nr:lectin domain containing protein [Pelagibacter phage HTVC031P]
MANTYLTRTFGSSPSTTLFTWSAWVKRGKLGTQQAMISGCSSHGANTGQLIYFTNDDKLAYYAQASGTVKCNLTTNAQFRDTNAWYHIVLKVDSSQANVANRVVFYVNNVERSYTTTVEHAQNWDAYFMLTTPTDVGRNGMNTSNYFDGVMSHMHMTHGYNYTPSTFGEYDANGVWTIKTSPTVNYNSNGFFILKDGNTGTDHSGNSETFSSGGGTLTKTEDCPSNVFATMNPLDNGQAGTTILLANGNNTFMTNSGSGDYGLKSTLGANSGKYYWEFKDMGQGQTCGTAEMDMRIVINKNGGAGLVGGQNWTVQRYSSSEMNIYNNGTYSRVSTLWGGSNSGDIYSIALDCDNGKIFMQKNGGGYKDLSGNTGDPVNGTNPTFSGLATDGSKYYGAWTENRGNVDNSCHYNFGNGYFGTTAVSSAGTNASGNGIFEYDVPTGYTALSTKGLNL